MHGRGHVFGETFPEVALEHELVEEEEVAEDGEGEEEPDGPAPDHGHVVLDGVEEGSDQEAVVHQEAEHEAQVLEQDRVVRTLRRKVRTFNLCLKKSVVI